MPGDVHDKSTWRLGPGVGEVPDAKIIGLIVFPVDKIVAGVVPDVVGKLIIARVCLVVRNP